MNSTPAMSSQSSDALFQPPIGAPKDRQDVFLSPSLADFSSKVSHYKQIAFSEDGFSRLRLDFRREMIEMAKEWTGRYSSDDSFTFSPDRPILFAGHQPELFHPGVWFKNFVLDRTAKQTGSISVNLVVDNDLAKSNAIFVPTINRDQLSKELVLFDMGGVGLPYEQKKLNHPEKLQSFFSRANQQIQSLPSFRLKETLFESFIERLQTVSKSTDSFPHAIAVTRHLIEMEAGVKNLELPISKLCEGTGFREFFRRIVVQCQSFFQIHNDILRRYRQVNDLKSNGRPIADLEVVTGSFDGEEVSWVEVPFWIWSDKNPSRQKLFVYLADQHLWLTDLPENAKEAPFLIKLSIDQCESDWTALIKSGTKIRTRALTTTLFSRLFLCDGFVHGIGGAIYDRITDQIAREFFGVELAPYLVATATRWLPLDDLNGGDSRSLNPLQTRFLEELKHRRREMKFHGERFFPTDPTDAQLRAAEEKEALLDRIPKRGEKLGWHRRMEAVNGKLSDWLKKESKKITADIDAVDQAQRSLAISRFREWSFLLYSKDLIDDLRNTADRMT